MDNTSYTYRIRLILSGIFLWEIIFWSLFAGFLWFAGYFSNSNVGIQLGFKNEPALWYLWIVVPMVVAFAWFMDWKNKRFGQLGNANIQGVILSPVSSLHSFLKFFFFRNAVVFVIIAMAQPVFGTKKVSGTMESLELVIAVDISSSMNVKDIDKTISRLDIAKRAMVQLINNLHGEKLGIVVFAGGAYAQLPLTMDYDAAKMYVNEIETGMVSNQGTNIAAALEVSQLMFTKTKTTKAVILVTDAEDHEGGTDPFLKKFREEGIELSVLGLGTTNGGLIPNNPDKPEFGYKVDEKGSPIVSKLNPAVVSSLAEKSGGTSTISESAYPDLTSLLRNLKQLKRTRVNTLEFDVRENRYQLPLVLGMLSWCLFVIWPRNSFSLSEKWNNVKNKTRMR